MFTSIKIKLSLSMVVALATIPVQAINTKLTVLGAGLAHIGTIGVASSIATSSSPLGLLAAALDVKEEKKQIRNFLASVAVTAGGLGVMAYGLSR
ncbi:MAG TPA: hypothetical protein VFF04_02320 [Candidatus Babeliales bacterium]|nr:hypothetical protein [Candidatus Babeliales bacterium]